MSERTATSLASPRLRALAQRQAQAADEQREHCDLCGAPIASDHRHLVDVRSRELLCACRPCSLLFDRRGAGAGHYRLVPQRRLALDCLQLSDEAWEQLRIPVQIAFFHRSSAAGRVVAFYPSPIGATESRLELPVWDELERVNPALATLEDDVEALLVNRARGARRQWIVPIEDCYRLVAVIRTSWRGLTGGKELWLAVDGFFGDLDDHTRSRQRR
jgi:hypothetical protein